MKIHPKDVHMEADVFWWEEMYGTDSLCPEGHEFEGLPYWVEYMPHDLQQEYLAHVDKREFVEDETHWTREYMIEKYGEEYNKYVKE